MPFIGTTYTEGLCPLVQQKLIDLSLQYTPQFSRDSLGYLNAITSDFNRQATGMWAHQVPGSGSYRGVEVTYVQRSLVSDVVNGTNAQPKCVDTGIDNGPQAVTVEITQNANYTLHFENDNLQRLCEPGMDFISGKIQSTFNAILTAIDQSILVTQAANMGLFYDNAATKNINLISPLTLGVNPAAMSSLMLQNMLIGYQGPVMVIGDVDLLNFADLANYGCCSWGGVSIDQMNGRFLPFLDPNITTAFGAGEFISLIPGTTQLLTFSRYNEPDKQYIDGMSSTGVVIDPVSGLPFDMRFVYDPRCNAWDVEISMWYQLFNLPSDVYAAGDTFNGVRGSLNWVIV